MKFSSPKSFFFREGRRQRLLKRIKMDNVDCDGHLGEDFHLRENIELYTLCVRGTHSPKIF